MNPAFPVVPDGSTETERHENCAWLEVWETKKNMKSARGRLSPADPSAAAMPHVQTHELGQGVFMYGAGVRSSEILIIKYSLTIKNLFCYIFTL